MGDKVLRGVAIGIVIGAAAVILFPGLRKSARPLAKAAMRSAVDAFEAGREAVAEFGETLEDIAAEVRAEKDAETVAAAATTAAAPASDG